MRNDYLWDGSGEPDPEVQRLERLLSEFRSYAPPPDLSAGSASVSARYRWTAAAAAVVLTAAAAWLNTRTAPGSWQVAREGARPKHLSVGEMLETGAAGGATLTIAGIGVLEVAPNSRLRLLRPRRNEHRMALEVGTIHARIWAPPRSFVVDTPSAVAVDLGCSYTLSVAPDGAGLVQVNTGWVSFARDGRESFIPAGAACQTRPGLGPGTPYREQAAPAFRHALQEFDFGQGGGGALENVLSQAAPEDAFTLWHLLTRGKPAEKERVYTALAALVPAPPGVTRDGILRGDREMLDAWWDRLGLGDTGWWRRLEGQWPDGAGSYRRNGVP